MNEIPEGTQLGQYVYFKDSHFGKSWRRLLGVLERTGFRKAEVATDSAAAFGKGSLTRHNLRWRIDGIETADPTAEQLKGMREGDLAILIPPKSKCGCDLTPASSTPSPWWLLGLGALAWRRRCAPTR